MELERLRKEIKTYLDSVNGQYSQFTIDFVEGTYQHLDNDHLVELSGLLGSLHYKINTIIDIMDESLPDFKFFKWLSKILEDTYIENPEAKMKNVN